MEERSLFPFINHAGEGKEKEQTEETASARKKVGIMGGTFNPIHLGHLIIGECAWQQLGLDLVLYIPAGNPPHKRERTGADNAQRLQMTRLAVAGNPHFQVSSIEMDDPEPSYTSRTLRKLTSEFPDTDFYFLMGSDSLLSFSSWKTPETIASLCTLCVAVRDLLPDQDFERAADMIRTNYHARIIKLLTPNVDLSSTMLRERIAEGGSIRYFMPEAEAEYILKEGIYRRK